MADISLMPPEKRPCAARLGHSVWRYDELPCETRLRADPRFKQVIRDLGIYNFWRRSGKWGDFARPLGDDDFEVFR